MLMPTVKIKFKCTSVESFIERYHSDVNPIGIFIRTRAPAQAGTQVNFELRLHGNEPLFVGSGAVIWARTDDADGLGVEPGMMLSFDQLNDASRQMFDEVLAEKQQRENGTFGTVPTLIRDCSEQEAPALPMTTKMTADELGELRARMLEEAAQGAGAGADVGAAAGASADVAPATDAAFAPTTRATALRPTQAPDAPMRAAGAADVRAATGAAAARETADTTIAPCVPVVRDKWQTSGVIVVESQLSPESPELTDEMNFRLGRLNIALLVLSVVSSLVILTAFLTQMGVIDPALHWLHQH
jgi:uncharacterized protein (TIGR02266 family)